MTGHLFSKTTKYHFPTTHLRKPRAVPPPVSLRGWSISAVRMPRTAHPQVPKQKVILFNWSIMTSQPNNNNIFTVYFLNSSGLTTIYHENNLLYHNS